MTNEEIINFMKSINYDGSIESFIEHCRHESAKIFSTFSIKIVDNNLIVVIDDFFLMQNAIYSAQVKSDIKLFIKYKLAGLIKLFYILSLHGIENCFAICEPFSIALSSLEESGFAVSDCEDIEIPPVTGVKNHSIVPMHKGIMSINDLKNKYGKDKEIKNT